MQIQSMSNQKFKGIYLLRVPNQAFKKPNNEQACLKQVRKSLGLNGNELSEWIEALRVIIGMPSKRKYIVEKNGIMVNAAEKEGMRTFSVISGKEKTYVEKKLSLKNLLSFMNEYDVENSKEAANCLSRKVLWDLNQKPYKEIKIKSLDDIKNTFKNLSSDIL